jgi:hypothetical protein
MTFAEKIASYPGLVRYHIFNSGDPSGQAGNTYGHDICSFIGAGEVNPNHSVLDTSVLASGNPTLRFTVLSQSSSGACGNWSMRFTSDDSIQFGAGETFNVQWQEKRSRYMFEHAYVNASGFKQSVIGKGDTPGLCDPAAPSSSVCATSSSSLKLVMQSAGAYFVPIMYDSNSIQFAQYVSAFSDYDYQPHQGTAPAGGTYCSYIALSNGSQPPPNQTNCFTYSSGLVNPTDTTTQWLTNTVEVTLGTITSGVFVNSHIRTWSAWENGTPFKWIDFFTDLPADGLAKYGRIWLLVYMTGKDPTEITNVASVWYGNVIVASGAVDPAYLTTTEVAAQPQLALVLN